MHRIHCKIDLFNVTGRMNFNEPCLQSIPKDFDLDHVDEDVASRLPEAEVFAEEAHYFLLKLDDEPQPRIASTNCISIRSLFIPNKNHIFISADYCQLELRIITNLCKDESLINAFNANTEQDVFVLLASKWLNLPPTDIDEEKRQNVKKGFVL